ncbi:unnamed protein product [Musa acuminata subsp. malaccensis]|uniref:(wild Malaysian banana) hypothetical protein n=1 Tax=Musa acuminata subsp. malaccensis TaxID=214687 RepID=A0A804JX64_MUSAM|nr:unnamed protein product [Musa acuminata subsp. malaccensis]
MESLSLQSLVPDDELMVRKSVSYRPRLGADYFIQHGQSEECDTRIKERAAELMEQIRSMSKDPTDILQTMNLVDSIQLLGLDYRFEKEISEVLNHIHDAHIDDHVLCDTALRFRLQRQQGYLLYAFNKFKDEQGSFMSSMKSDVNVLLSLYKEAYLRIHGYVGNSGIFSFPLCVLKWISLQNIHLLSKVNINQNNINNRTINQTK